MRKSISTQTIPNKTHIATLMQKSGVNFGTSGARGRVKDMTDQICYAYTTAFLQHPEAQDQLNAGAQIGFAQESLVER